MNFRISELEATPYIFKLIFHPLRLKCFCSIFRMLFGSASHTSGNAEIHLFQQMIALEALNCAAYLRWSARDQTMRAKWFDRLLPT